MTDFHHNMNDHMHSAHAPHSSPASLHDAHSCNITGAASACINNINQDIVSGAITGGVVGGITSGGAAILPGVAVGGVTSGINHCVSNVYGYYSNC